MFHKISMPDYDNSILGIPSSILKHYGIRPRHKTLADLDRALSAQKYKNIILMVFDGMGMDVIRRNLPPLCFLDRNCVRDISSVFPCTTTAATKTIYSGLAPNEHGWLGWQMYFHEYDKCIELFRQTDNYTGRPVDDGYLRHLAFTPVFERVGAAHPDINSVEIFADRARPGIGGPTTLGEFFTQIKKTCAAYDENFIVAYWNNPDSISHKRGPGSTDVQNVVSSINAGVANLARGLTDTLIIITADHGQTDITENVKLNDYPDIMECLRHLPTIEARAISFYLRPEYASEFPARFNRHFGDDFILVPHDDYIKNYLGPATDRPHPRLNDFIGDFVAIATGARLIAYDSPDTEWKEYLGHHAGLTTDEMRVPLIIIQC